MQIINIDAYHKVYEFLLKNDFEALELFKHEFTCTDLKEFNSARLMNEVCQFFETTIEKLKSKSRKGKLPYARGIYYLIMYDNTLKSYQELGNELNQDHSTVLYFKRKVWENNDIDFVNKYKEFKGKYGYK